MKRFFIILIVLLISFLAYIAYHFITLPKAENKVIIPEKKYSFFYEPELEMTIPIYLSNQEIVSQISDIGVIASLDNQTKFLVDNVKLNYLYEYLHNDEVLHHYELSFILPEIESSYYIDDLFLDIEIDLTNYSFYLGSINVLYNPTYYNNDFFYWDYLQATKNDGAHIKELQIGYSDEVLIDQVLVDNKILPYYLKNGEIIIEVEHNMQIFDQTFIIFEYGDQKQIIKNFKFFYHYDLLNNINYNEYKLI